MIISAHFSSEFSQNVLKNDLEFTLQHFLWYNKEFGSAFDDFWKNLWVVGGSLEWRWHRNSSKLSKALPNFLLHRKNSVGQILGYFKRILGNFTKKKRDTCQYEMSERIKSSFFSLSSPLQCRCRSSMHWKWYEISVGKWGKSASAIAYQVVLLLYILSQNRSDCTFSPTRTISLWNKKTPTNRIA